MSKVEQDMYAQGFRTGWVNALTGQAPPTAEIAAQMVTTPRGLGYVEGYTASIEAL